ncbi:MAG: hypothetical protein Q9195_007873 [Heterodermia aff. obscurata]
MTSFSATHHQEPTKGRLGDSLGHTITVTQPLFVVANPVKPTSFVAKFDDIPGSGIVPELTRVPTPYNGLSWPAFGVTNLSQTVTTVPAQSRPNVIANFTLTPGDRLLVTTANTKTSSFSLQSLYNGCVVASQTGVAAESCELLYTGVKTSGAKINTTCDFVADLLSTNNPMALCKFPASFTGLKTIFLNAIKTGSTSSTTVPLVDNVSGSIP